MILAPPPRKNKTGRRTDRTINTARHRYARLAPTARPADSALIPLSVGAT